MAMADAEDLHNANALMSRVRSSITGVRLSSKLCSECAETNGDCFWQLVISSGSVASALTLYKQTPKAREIMLQRCPDTELTAVLGVELANADPK